ncbi:MAG: L-methionine (R)-S-oxide reductase [Spirosomataceae bacterium]|jgi:GAF domain-containing protein
MAETLTLPRTENRSEIYHSLFPQVEALLLGEDDFVANTANIAAALREAFGFFWVGFYFVKDDQLVLGPFQGPIACTRIPFHKGVCGKCYTDAETITVPNVDEFPGHIACSSASKSEIVLPVFNKKNEVVAVLDVDSDKLNDFSEADKIGLEKIIALLSR